MRILYEASPESGKEKFNTALSCRIYELLHQANVEIATLYIAEETRKQLAEVFEVYKGQLFEIILDSYRPILEARAAEADTDPNSVEPATVGKWLNELDHF